MAATIQNIEFPTKPRALDTSGNNNHGKIYSGRALEFDGVTDYLTTAASADLVLGNTNHTLTAWFNTSDATTSAYNYIVAIGDTSGGMSSMGFKGDGSSGSATLFNSNYGAEGTTTAAPIRVNTWYRLTMVYTGGGTNTIDFYLNGVFVEQESLAINITGGKLTIGNHVGLVTPVFEGMISDVQVWDKAWTADEVAYDYANPESLALNASGTALTESNLIRWYPMQDGHRGQQSYILDGANTGLGAELLADTGFDNSSSWNGAGGSGSAGWTFSNGEAYSTSVGQWLTQPGVVNTAGVTYKSIVRAKRATSGVAATMYIYHGSVGVKSHTLTDDYADYVTYLPKGDSTVFYIYNHAGNIKVTSASLKPINDKHNATTVFYGDELITVTADRDMSGANNWADYNGGTESPTGGILQITVDGGSTTQGAQLAVSNLGTIAAGRTYRIQADLDFISGFDTDLAIQFALGNSAVLMTASDGSPSDGTMTTTEQTFYADVTTADASGALRINCTAVTNNSGSNNVFTVDDVSVKEVGIATSWTDADQQLDIAQPALQSYNELAWFDGTADYVQLSNPYSHATISVSAWVYKTRHFDHEFIFCNQNSSAQGAYLYTNAEGEVLARVNGTDATSTGTIPLGKWNHLVFTYDKINIKIYINGVLDGTASQTSDISTDYNATIGNNSASLTQYLHQGAITEVAIFGSRAISAANVLELYNEGKAGDAMTITDASHITGYFRNNGLSTWTDLSGGGNNGTPTSLTETILIPQGVDGSRDAQGFIMNKARDTSSLNLTSGAYASSPTGGFVGDDDFSIACWFKTTDSDAWILSKGEQDAGGKRYALYVHGSNYLTAEIDDNATFVTWNGSATVNDGDWHYAVVTYDRNGNGQIYLDDSTDGSATSISSSTGSLDPTNHRDFTVGGNSDPSTLKPYTGQVDGVTVYTKVLSLTEVQRNYKATKGSHRN